MDAPLVCLWPAQARPCTFSFSVFAWTICTLCSNTCNLNWPNLSQASLLLPGPWTLVFTCATGMQNCSSLKTPPWGLADLREKLSLISCPDRPLAHPTSPHLVLSSFVDPSLGKKIPFCWPLRHLEISWSELSPYCNSLPLPIIIVLFTLLQLSFQVKSFFTYSGICFYLTFAFISSMACNCCMILVLKASSYEQQKKLPMFQALCMVFLTR